VVMQLLPTRVGVEQLDPDPGPLRRGQHFALTNGATASMSASSDVKLMFKSILAAETEKKSRRSGHEARPRSAASMPPKRPLEAAAAAAAPRASNSARSRTHTRWAFISLY